MEYNLTSILDQAAASGANFNKLYCNIRKNNRALCFPLKVGIRGLIFLKATHCEFLAPFFSSGVNPVSNNQLEIDGTLAALWHCLRNSYF